MFSFYVVQLSSESFSVFLALSPSLEEVIVKKRDVKSNQLTEECEHSRCLLSECENKMLNSKNMTKTAWNIFISESNKNKNQKITSLSINGNTIIDPNQIATIFQKNFDTSPEYHDVLDVSSFGVVPTRVPTLFLLSTDRWEVYGILSNLPNKFSAGLDKIPVLILKRAAEFVCEPLTNIINECLFTGVFPLSLKMAKLIPVHKKGDPQNVLNYRPV